MNYRALLALLGILAAQSVLAQLPIACVGQIVPIKPPSMLACSSATPLCITDANGIRGHWAWLCPGISPPATDYSIPLGINVPNIKSPVETLIEIERLRSLRLQNEQIQQQLTTSQQPRDSGAAQPESDPATSFKVIYNCGFLDGMSNAMTASGNAAGATAIQEVLKRTNCDQIRQYAGNTNAPPAQPPDPHHESGVGKPLDNADIIQMVKIGVRESTIIYMIDLRPPRYSLGPGDRAKLQDSGVSEAIIKEMEDRASGN